MQTKVEEHGKILIQRSDIVQIKGMETNGFFISLHYPLKMGTVSENKPTPTRCAVSNIEALEAKWDQSWNHRIS